MSENLDRIIDYEKKLSFQDNDHQESINSAIGFDHLEEWGERDNDDDK